ncbi:hypothetical protein [Actinoplanes derwentensis]|uniref:Uncharacterized protein n=1 Tax=Actinoplanes derwentensis TaxID=113562 RepID=A0A1H1YEL9_9ACTN|nr:hypothetical protein [Actinoplanes derwentensis]GID81114.1 hypothetical protein Ade03nite_00380 [Actinoplanes derwentensis]SDT19890.1 hypothetical protein SAMN04489716_2823 [Actinoplanes derwentensis]
MTTIEETDKRQTRRRYEVAGWVVAIVAGVVLRLLGNTEPALDHWYVQFGALLLIVAAFEVFAHTRT